MERIKASRYDPEKFPIRQVHRFERLRLETVCKSRLFRLEENMSVGIAPICFVDESLAAVDNHGTLRPLGLVPSDNQPMEWKMLVMLVLYEVTR